jgi:sulfoxide reductase heme-binding subunit YedZ
MTDGRKLIAFENVRVKNIIVVTNLSLSPRAMQKYRYYDGYSSWEVHERLLEFLVNDRVLVCLEMLLRFLNSRLVLWLLLSAPGIVTVVRYILGDTFYGEVVHFTGDLSAQLLIITMAATPIRLLFPAREWTRWLIRRRRYFGVAAFGYAALHTAVYLARMGTLERILSDATSVGFLTGWLALIIFVPLAATSNDWSVRRLRLLWKRIHNWVYAAAILTFAHWLILAFDPIPGVIHLSILAALMAIRVVMTRVRSRAGT